jgi:hypothetical protein
MPYNFHYIKTSEQNIGSEGINRDFRVEMMKGSKGLLGLAFVGILFKLNVLENSMEI